MAPIHINYNLDNKRYKTLQSQLDKSPELKKAYTEEITKLIKKPNVEVADEDPLSASDPNRYLNYIPQGFVSRYDRITSKIRPVLDAS